MNCIITYQKSNGEIFIRPYDHSAFALGKRVGDETSMGWTVLDIHYQFSDGNYYHEDDFDHLIRKNKRTMKQRIAGYLMHKLNAWR